MPNQAVLAQSCSTGPVMQYWPSLINLSLINLSLITSDWSQVTSDWSQVTSDWSQVTSV